MTGGTTEQSAVLRTIAGRIAALEDELALRMLERFRAEIVDYANASDELLYDEVLMMVRYNLVAFTTHLGTGIVLPPEELDRIRHGVARRVHQGISLAALSQAYHLFGEELWHATLAQTSDAERDAAIDAAGHVMRHVRTVWTACAQAYLDEAEGVWSDRQVLHRDLLDAVLRGHAAAPEARREARALGIALQDDYAVIVARAPDGDDAAAQRRRLRETLGVAREELRSSAGPALVGLRAGELVALVPLPAQPAAEEIAAAARAFAGATPVSGFVIGVGGRHPTPAGVPLAYAEAREAADIAEQTGVRGSAVHFEQVLLTHVVNASPAATAVLRDMVATLRDYDAQRSAELVTTLRTYVDSAFSVARSAEHLFVHPNTVTYRLRRIQELTGRDPRDPDDLVALCLALKLDC